ncbi:BTAD domain-containing putative transcriptional regulator [Microbispora sp. KK1-11]|uniref:BTAD domain-containing putative transcriptional regulator n=1 Tax=Microbispora sp. KK1-11 TaxID=2053005 RepID=UPI00115A97EC|nr:BTAD domain-containing putative transcriptional regulator [Microbispora sp. KK1-11]TQS29868.1 AfsR/SARP family transcriptional regulator [Microbispora sp. KK1-11]
MRFGILGDTRVWRDDGTEVPLGGPARRALLALLLIRPGRVVPSDRLIEEIDPGGLLSAHALQSQVSRLRTALGPAAAIERSGAGYRIVVTDDDVDACRFERLAGEGRTALRDGEAERAVTLLREALDLWRGPALAELTESETAQAAATRLEELRLAALEDRIEGELRLGEHRAAVAELRELVGRHPLRERLAGLLMRALAAEGRQAEALVVFEETRRHLAEELGADPSAELVALHRELLSVDPSPSPAAPPAQLTSFVGRDEEVAEVAGLLRVARLVTLLGPGGVGKTRLSVEVAGAEADEVCFVELAALGGGAGPARAVLGALGLRERGLQVGDGPQTPLDRLIAALSHRVLLLVLDNCEHVVEEAAALAARLLAACPRLRVLATSREPLGVIGEHLHQVRPLDGDAAVRLFTDRARAVRRGFAADPQRVRRICAALDDLPLAVELAAARLRALDLDELEGRLNDRLTITARGSRPADGRHRTLRSVVAWSWDMLTEPEQRAARRFTVFAAGATAESARQVCGTDAETLESLVDKSLLEVSRGRYRMLETIRAYGAERLGEAGDRELALRAHARHVLELMRAADPHLRRAGQLEWLPILVAEHENLLAAVRWAVEAPDVATALELLASASTYLWIRGVSAAVAPYAIGLLGTLGDTPPDGLGEEYATCVLLAASDRETWRRHRVTAEKALAAAWPGGRAGRYPAALLLWMLRNAGESDAQGAFTLLTAQHDSPEPWARAVARYVSGFGALGERDVAAAVRDFGTAAEEFRVLGDRWGTALALDMLAGLAGGRGDHARAIALTDEALTLTGRLGAQEDAADLLVNRADYLAGDDAEAARADYAKAADLARRAGSTTCLGAALRGLGDIALRKGDLDEAERLYAEAAERLDPHWIRSLGNRVRTLAGLGRVAEARGDNATARARYREAAEAAAAGGSTPDALRLLGLPEALVEAVSRW